MPDANAQYRALSGRLRDLNTPLDHAVADALDALLGENERQAVAMAGAVRNLRNATKWDSSEAVHGALSALLAVTPRPVEPKGPET